MTPSAPASGAAQQPIALISILILAAAWILPGLVGHDPWKPDEAYTFGLIYSLLHGGDWVVPQLAQEPFMEKPPLFYLSAAAIASLLSPPFTLHDAARLTTGLYMALTFAFIAASARELYGANRGWVATLIFMGCLGIVIRSHQMITDISLLTGFALAFYGLALGLRRPVPASASDSCQKDCWNRECSASSRCCCRCFPRGARGGMQSALLLLRRPFCLG
jgi:4-amino-4-deoxy-L-arabinose transferase-like glycosyltransferase